MKREYSAGGIVVSKTTRGWYVLLMADMKGRWTFPKGLIENGEKASEAAKREVGEEVGIDEPLVLIHALTPIEYFYFRGGVIKKTVKYFLFESSKRVKLTTQKEEGIREARWIPLEKAPELVDYQETNAPLLVETAQILKKRTQ